MDESKAMLVGSILFVVVALSLHVRDPMVDVAELAWLSQNGRACEIQPYRAVNLVRAVETALSFTGTPHSRMAP